MTSRSCGRRQRLSADEARYIHIRLNRARCQPKLEALERATHRSWPNIIEWLLETMARCEAVSSSEMATDRWEATHDA